MRQLHLYAFDRPSFSLWVHANRDSGTCPQCRQEQFVRIWTGIYAAKSDWLVRCKLMGHIVIFCWRRGQAITIAFLDTSSHSNLVIGLHRALTPKRSPTNSRGVQRTGCR